MMDSRGQSEMVGITLIIGVVLFTAIGAVASQAAIINQYQSAAEGEAAIDSLMLLDSEISKVSYNDAITTGTARITANQYGAVADERGGMLTVFVDTDSGTTTLYTQRLNVVRYTNDPRTVVLQGGAVIKQGRNGDPIMVSNPEFSVTSNSITLPVTGIDTQSSSIGTGRIQIAQKSSQTAVDELRTPSNTNSITIRVTSEYVSAWRSYFESQLQTGSATVTSDSNSVSLTISTDPSNPIHVFITETIVSLS